MDNKGKMNVAGFIILLLVAFGAFSLVKYLGANFTVSQISKEVKDRIGLVRGGDFSAEMGEEEIRKILQSKEIIFDEERDGLIEVNIDTQKQLIEYYFRYKIEVDYLFFKKVREIEEENQMLSYR